MLINILQENSLEKSYKKIYLGSEYEVFLYIP